jgi:tetratricopeptide (TPR) repeat protein
MALDRGEDSLPSVAACRQMEPARLTRLVRGELDWIVMKAIEKDRARRYETASGFAADVQRYLAGEPVLAAPASPWYRLRKFVRRNRGGLAAAALVLSCLVLLGGGLGWAVRDRSAREAEASRQRGQRQAKVAGEVESIFADVDRLEEERKWHEALEAGRRAAAAVASGEADAATLEQVRQRLKDLEFIDRLEQIRMLNAAWVEGKFDNAGADRDYARAFRDYGVDVQELAEETSIDRLNARPSLAIALASALDHWIYARLNIGEQDSAGLIRLVAVARGIDPDRLRDRLRSTWGQPVSPELRDELRRVAQSIDIRAQSPATLAFLASTLQRVEDSDTAVRILRDAQNVYRGDFWLNFDLGSALSVRKEFEGAIRYYTAAVAIRPSSTAALYNLGNALYEQRKLDEAVSEYRKAVELDPKHVRAHNNLGNALRDQRKLDEAVAEYRKAVELRPGNAGAHYHLGNALRATKDLDGAERAYREAVRLDGDRYGPAMDALSQLLLFRGKVKEAVAVARKAVELAPKSALAAQVLGLAEYRAGNWTACIVALEKSCALQDNPKGGDFWQWFLLAMANSQHGQKQKARDWYDRAVVWMDKNQPKNEELRRFRAEAAALLELAEKK